MEKALPPMSDTINLGGGERWSWSEPLGDQPAADRR